MRILTHNSLRNPAKEVVNGFPLQLEITEMHVSESEMNADFIKGTLPSLEWKSLLVAAAAVGLADLPAHFDAALLKDETFLRSIHTLLLDIHIDKGFLMCPETGRRFPIENGIPNMMLPEVDV